MRCSVKTCKSSNDQKACEISFYRFPANPALRKKWISFCRRDETFNPTNSHICMLHFKPEDIENRLKYEMGFAKYRILKRDAVPMIDTNEIKNAKRNSKRASRFEKWENKKLVESILVAYETEEKAKLHEEPEANINDYIDPDNCYVSEKSIVKIGTDLEFIDEHDYDTKNTLEHSDDSQQLGNTKATQTKLMDDEYACALVTVTRNFLAYNLKCSHCDACFSIRDWEELTNHIESEHRWKMEAQFEPTAVDETCNQTLNFDEETVDETETAHHFRFGENDIKNKLVPSSYSTDAYRSNQFLKMKKERPTIKNSRKRKQCEISKEKCHNLEFNMETSDAQLVLYIIDLLHSDPTLWFIDGIKTIQYKNGIKNLHRKICEKYEIMDQKELHNCLIKIRDWYQKIFKQKKSDELSFPQSEYYRKLVEFLPDGSNYKTCEICERAFEDHLQYFAHKKMEHGENDNEDSAEISLEYLKENLNDYFHSRYRNIPAEQLYECRICFKKYGRRNVLIDHVRTHLDIRNHICHICGKMFIQKRNFAAHKRRHLGLRKWKCLICGKAYKTCTALTVHRGRHHRPIEGTIEEIEKNTSRHPQKKTFRKGQKEKRKQIPKFYITSDEGGHTRWACLYCDKHFSHQAGARRHYTNIHKMEMEVKEAEEPVISSIEIIDEAIDIIDDDIKFEVILSDLE